MAAMDEFRAEREAVKNGSFKEKLSYFWTYYKWYAIIPFLIIVCIISFIHENATATDTVLNGILLNINPIEGDPSDLTNGFYAEQDIDRKLYDINLNTGLSYHPESTNNTSAYATIQALMAWNAAGELDFICGDQSAMTALAYKGYCTDLSKLLTEEQFAGYKPYFLYIDQDVVDQRNEAYEKNIELSSIPIPDPDKPETMKKPVPVLLNLPPGEALVQAYGDITDTIIFGICSNATNKEMAMNFIKYATK